jgi:tetratricopeptide (TPR) repeat protein
MTTPKKGHVMTNHNITLLDFSGYIAERTRAFTGREWVFRAIDDWLADPQGPRFFLLTGEPGSGKTAIAARLGQFSEGEAALSGALPQLTPGFLSAVHFCSARDRRWIHPQVFAESLAMQLAARYPVYARALAERSGDRQIRIEVEQQVGEIREGQVIGVVIKRLEVSGMSPEDAFIRIVREPLETLLRGGVDRPLVILVDALDESLVYSGEVGIVSLLAQAEQLPPGVRFILTSRQDQRVENVLLDAGRLLLSAAAYEEQNLGDIGEYTRKRLSESPDLSIRMTQLPPRQASELVEMIARNAEGNFLYVTFLLDAMVKGQQPFGELAGLPAGLDGLYYESLTRLIKLGGRAWMEDYAPLMGVLSVAQRGLTLTQLHSYTGQSESAVWERLGDLQQFVEAVPQSAEQEAEPEQFRLYHQSVIDFLHRRSLRVEKNTLRNSYYSPPEEWHRRIIAHYRAGANSWNEIDWSRVDDYGLRYLAAHLYGLRDEINGRKELSALICRSFMLEKRARYTSPQPFAEDVALAIDALRAEKPVDFVQLVRCHLISATLGSAANRVPPRALGTLARLGRAGIARSYATLIQEHSNRSRAYLLIGGALLEQGVHDQAVECFDRAFTSAQRISSDYSKAMALSDLAQAFQAAENQAGLDQVLDELGSAAAESGDISLLRTAAEWLSRAGRSEAAEVFASRLAALERAASRNSYFFSDTSQRSEVSRLIKAGSLDEALKIADGIFDSGAKASAYSELAPGLFEAGRVEAATDLAKRALDAAGKATFGLFSSSNKEQLHFEVARAFAEIGDRERASSLIREQLAEVAATENNNSRIILSIVAAARTWALIGEPGIALETAWHALAEFEKQGDQTTLAGLNELVSWLAELGGTDAAIAFARRLAAAAEAHGLSEVEIQASFYPSMEGHFSNLAAILAQLGDREEALKLINRLIGKTELPGDGGSTVPALTAAAAALARNGHRARARHLIQAAWTSISELQDGYLKSQWLVQLARARISIEEQVDLTPELEMAKAFSPRYQSTALASIFGVLMDAGDIERAEEVLSHALSIKEDFLYGGTEKAGANLEIARALAQHGLKERAVTLANEAISATGDSRLNSNQAALKADIAFTLALAGETETSRRLAREALAEIAKIELSFIQRDLNKVVEALIVIGERGRAEELSNTTLLILEAVDEDWYRQGVLPSVAHSCSLLKDARGLQRVMTVARQIENEAYRVEALSAIISVLIEMGEQAKARELADQALTLTLSVKDAFWSIKAVSALAPVLVQVEDRAGLDRIFERAQNLPDSNRAECLIALIPAWGLLANRDAVLELLRNAGSMSPYNRARLLGVATGPLLKIEEPELAAQAARRGLAAIEEQRDASVTPNMFAQVIPALSLVHDVEGLLRALQATRRLPYPREWAPALRLLLPALVEADIEASTEDAWKALAARPEQHDEALTEIAAIHVRRRQHEQAQGTIDRIKQEKWKAVAFVRAVRVTAELGERDVAAEYARQALGIALGLESQAALLADLALALAHVGETGKMADRVKQYLMKAQTVRLVNFSASDICKAVRALVSVEDEQGLERAMALMTAASGPPPGLDPSWADHTFSHLNADTLLELTRTLADAGYLDRARGLVDAALAAGRDDPLLVRVLSMIGKPGLALDLLTRIPVTPRSMSRAELFRNIELGAETLAAVDRGETLWQLCGAILEVESWWKSFDP